MCNKRKAEYPSPGWEACATKEKRSIQAQGGKHVTTKEKPSIQVQDGKHVQQKKSEVLFITIGVFDGMLVDTMRVSI